LWHAAHKEEKKQKNMQDKNSLNGKQANILFLFLGPKCPKGTNVNKYKTFWSIKNNIQREW